MSNWIASQFRTFRRIYRWWREQLTPIGKVIFLVMLCALPTFADSGAALAIAFIGSSVMLMVTASVSYLFRPRLVVHATYPRVWMQFEARPVQLEITNRSRLPIYDTQIRALADPERWDILDAPHTIEALRGKETIVLSVTLRPRRRGLHMLPDLRATTLFPLQIVQRSEDTRIERSVLILPFYHELHSCYIAQNVPHDARGQTLAMQTVGLTGEYVGSREYQPGVPVRKWDYASWARLGQPVVREFSEPRHPSVALIVDTSLLAEQQEATGPVREVEAIISLAASISDAMIAHGNRIELLVVGGDVLTDRDGALGDVHLTVLEQLALAEHSTPEQFGTVAAELEQLPVTWDTLIFLGQQWLTPHQQLLEQTTGNQVYVVRVQVGMGVRDRATVGIETHSVTVSQVETGTVEL